MSSPTTIIKTDRAYFGISDRGQIMGTEAEAGLASVEPEGIYEHMSIDHLEEGYTLAYRIGEKDFVRYDVYGDSDGIIYISSDVYKNDNNALVKVSKCRTDNELINIHQTFIIPKNSTRILIRMEITNCSKNAIDIDDLLLKRFADIDVDTGGSAGWADFKGRWDKNRYSVFSYTLEDEAPQGKRPHIVNLMALPSDVPLDDVFIGKHGDKPYKTRLNTKPVTPLPSHRMDADGIIQWKVGRLLVGQSAVINLMYDCFESFYK